MTSFEVEIEGFDEAMQKLRELEEDLESDEVWIIGTGVEYAIYVEFGTSDMDPRPFFRPAIAELLSKGAEKFLEDNTQYTAETLDDIDDVVATVALALETKVKEIITDKGLVDTGTMRASVAALPGGDPSDLATTADIPDTDSGPPYPPDFGPSAREKIEVET